MKDEVLQWFPKTERGSRGGKTVALLDQGTGQYATAGDLHRQASMLMKRYGLLRVDQRVGRSRRVSFRTQAQRSALLHQICNDIKTALPGLRALVSLKPGHVECLVGHWRERGLAPKTLEVKLSMLRVLGAWVGKPGLVGPTSSYLDARERQMARAPRVRAWSALGVEPEDAVGKLCRNDPDTGWMLWLCLRFGLRLREAMLLDPRMRSVEHLPVVRGTKGGRTRTIPLTAADHAMLLSFERWLDSTGHDRCIIPAGVTEATYRAGYYYRLARQGITQRGLGVTTHGLRHEYAQRLVADLEKEMGGGFGVKEAYGQCMPRMPDSVALEVSSRLGHARPAITYQYMGRPIGQMIG